MNKTVVSFGEIMLRLSPPDMSMICDTKSFSACYGGSESNVLVCLSSLGDKTRFITALPQNELGDAVVRHLNTYKVETDSIVRRGDVLGIYFLEQGFGARPGKVIYNRKHAEINNLAESDIDYDAVFADCGIFHICGISFSLSEAAKAVSFRLLQEAKKRNILISFDFNYRSKLWTIPTAKAVYQEIVNYADILFCSGRDLETFLDTDTENFYKKYTSEYLVVREREVCSADLHKANAVIYRKTADGMACAKTEQTAIQVLERIGSGDAFAAGVLHALNRNREDIQNAINFGMACFVLKHTVKGDVLTMDASAVESYFADVSKDVNR